MSAAFESLSALRSEAIDRLRDGEADWIGRLRDEAMTSFEEQGFPTRRLEDWKSTNLAPLEAISFERVGTPEQSPVVVTGDGVPELRFVDGRLDTANTQAENLPAGVRLASFAEVRRQAPELLEGRLAGLASPKRNAMVALQTAFLDDGAVLTIDAGVEIDTPIKLCFSTSGDSTSPSSAAFPRLLVIAGERSRGTISIECEAAAPGLTALVAEFYLAAGARFESVQIQDEYAGRVHFTSIHARLERDASFDSHVYSLSPGLIRSELEIQLAEPGAETRMRGFYLGRGDGHVDHFTTVDHAAESCTSDEEYRGVLGDRANGVFRGRVIVRPDAQKTDARQSNPNLLISEHAGVDSKPQLEIYADDVRASHGSTTGQLDPDALFFLRARGIDARAARLLLTRAFAHKIVDGIENERLRASTSTRVDLALNTLESDVPSGVGGSSG
jgi:Fe-S cluster assembly protein SufD